MFLWTLTLLLLFDYLTPSPVLSQFDDDTPIFLKIDWSVERMSCILIQSDDSAESCDATTKLRSSDLSDFNLVPPPALKYGLLRSTRNPTKSTKEITARLFRRWYIVAELLIWVDTTFEKNCSIKFTIVAQLIVFNFQGTLYQLKCCWVQELLLCKFIVIRHSSIILMTSTSSIVTLGRY